jgi:ubiquinone/menaquinone biosynthesis C-methylase UbiE
MDLRRLELPDASCRGVWCSASLLHIPRQTAPRAVAELARVSRAGAPIVVFLKRQQGAEQEEFQHYQFSDAGDARRFFAYYTPEEARQLLEDAGLAILDQASVPGDSPSAPEWISLVARKL